MEEPIAISNINDFCFCPASIYYHNLMPGGENIQFQCRDQINGTAAHKTIDSGTYSSRSSILLGKEVYCEKYGIAGRIDSFDIDKGILTERKKHVWAVYDGLVFQLYAQCFALREMGYSVKKLRMHSIDDNKNYDVKLPEEDHQMLCSFEKVIDSMRTFRLSDFVQNDLSKCKRCIYRPMCGSTDLNDDQE